MVEHRPRSDGRAVSELPLIGERLALRIERTGSVEPDRQRSVAIDTVNENRGDRVAGLGHDDRDRGGRLATTIAGNRRSRRLILARAAVRMANRATGKARHWRSAVAEIDFHGHSRSIDGPRSFRAELHHERRHARDLVGVRIAHDRQHRLQVGIVHRPLVTFEQHCDIQYADGLGAGVIGDNQLRMNFDRFQAVVDVHVCDIASELQRALRIQLPAVGQRAGVL